MEIKNINVDDLKAAPYNPRTISQHEFESLQRSIDEFGWVEPIVVNKRNMTVVGGHMRLNAARALKLDEVPVTFVDLDEGHEKALNIALNKISGEFDSDMLAEILHDLDDELVDLTGFTDEEIEGLQDGFVEHDDEGPKTDDKVKRYTIEELKTERDKFFNATQMDDGGFVDWLSKR